MPKQVMGTPLDDTANQNANNSNPNNTNDGNTNGNSVSGVGNSDNASAGNANTNNSTDKGNNPAAFPTPSNSGGSGSSNASSGNGDAPTQEQGQRVSGSDNSLADLAKKLSSWKDDFLNKDGGNDNKPGQQGGDGNAKEGSSENNNQGQVAGVGSSATPANSGNNSQALDNKQNAGDNSSAGQTGSHNSPAPDPSKSGIGGGNDAVSGNLTNQQDSKTDSVSSPSDSDSQSADQSQQGKDSNSPGSVDADKQHSTGNTLPGNEGSSDTLNMNNASAVSPSGNNPPTIPNPSSDSNVSGTQPSPVQSTEDEGTQKPSASQMTQGGNPSTTSSNASLGSEALGDTAGVSGGNGTDMNNPTSSTEISGVSPTSAGGNPQNLTNNNSNNATVSGAGSPSNASVASSPQPNAPNAPAGANAVPAQSVAPESDNGLLPTNSSVSQTGTPAPQQGGKYPYTIEQLLEMVVEKDASDLHITVGYPAMLRIDGDLEPVGQDLVTEETAPDLILPVLDESKRELLEVNREVDLAYAFKDIARFRINAYYERGKPAAAFRLIPGRIRSIEELKLPGVFHQFAKLPQGFVLVTGPTGSGKSTTLAAILQEINANRPTHIITVEDPIEYLYPRGKALIDQREMHEDTHSWEIALRSALRQDPDVVLVGEMRDYETISSAITLAETGHLVFATLHTNNAAQTIDRIIDVFPEHQQEQVRTQLSNIVEAVIAQRLVPVQGGGRRAVNEILLVTPAVRNLIREGKTHQIDNVIRTSMDIGMKSLEHSLVELVREGSITVDDAETYAVHPEEIVRLLK